MKEPVRFIGTDGRLYCKRDHGAGYMSWPNFEEYTLCENLYEIDFVPSKTAIEAFREENDRSPYYLITLDIKDRQIAFKVDQKGFLMEPVSRRWEIKQYVRYLKARHGKDNVHVKYEKL